MAAPNEDHADQVDDLDDTDWHLECYFNGLGDLQVSQDFEDDNDELLFLISSSAITLKETINKPYNEARRERIKKLFNRALEKVEQRNLYWPENSKIRYFVTLLKDLKMTFEGKSVDSGQLSNSASSTAISGNNDEPDGGNEKKIPQGVPRKLVVCTMHGDELDVADQAMIRTYENQGLQNESASDQTTTTATEYAGEEDPFIVDNALTSSVTLRSTDIVSLEDKQSSAAAKTSTEDYTRWHNNSNLAMNSLILCLEDLTKQHVPNPTSKQTVYRATRLLNTIFDVGISKVKFSVDEGKKIGPLVARSLAPIKLYVSHTACSFITSLQQGILIKRSAIQFLLDDYANFPSDDDKRTLKEKFAEFKLDEMVQVLDEIIEKWKDRSDSEEDSEDSDGEREKAIKIEWPKRHTWGSLTKQVHEVRRDQESRLQAFVEAFEVKSLRDIVVDGSKIFCGLAKHQWKRLNKLLHDIYDSADGDIITIVELVRNFALSHSLARSPERLEFIDFITLAEFVMAYVGETATLLEDAFTALPDSTRSTFYFAVFDGRNATMSQKLKYSKTMARRMLSDSRILGDNFWKRISLALLNMLNVSVYDLKALFNSLYPKVKAEMSRMPTVMHNNNSYALTFKDALSAVYHYFKHRNMALHEYDVPEYFDLLRKTVQEAVKSPECMSMLADPTEGGTLVHMEHVSIANIPDPVHFKCVLKIRNGKIVIGSFYEPDGLFLRTQCKPLEVIG